jgi:hypothetical protein
MSIIFPRVIERSAIGQYPASDIRHQYCEGIPLAPDHGIIGRGQPSCTVQARHR